MLSPNVRLQEPYASILATAIAACVAQRARHVRFLSRTTSASIVWAGDGPMKPPRCLLSSGAGDCRQWL